MFDGVGQVLWQDMPSLLRRRDLLCRWRWLSGRRRQEQIGGCLLSAIASHVRIMPLPTSASNCEQRSLPFAWAQLPGGALRVTKQGLEAIDGEDEAVVAPKETSVLNPGVAHLRRPPCTGQCANKTGKAAFAKTCRVAPPNIICLNRLCV
jgi:hypothetical protein